MTRQLLVHGKFACFLTLAAFGASAHAQGPAKKNGVLINDPRAHKGYTLIAPMNSTKSYLIDMEGRVAKIWESDCTPALFPYLLDNGNLLRPGTMGKGGLAAPGAGGRVQEFSWEGKLVWDYKFEGKNQQYAHHDIARLPNGNILMIVSERKSEKEAVAAGRRPLAAKSGMNVDCIVEVKPTGKTSGEIVWEWHAWDHAVQDNDKTLDNFAKISERPERIDVNYSRFFFTKAPPKKEDADKLKGIGYLGGPGAKANNFWADWTHFNGVAYNAELDQIMISVHSFSEIWIIDHSTTTKEAAGSTGGKCGKGGDLLYRWGNPQTYRSGTNVDQRLFSQHNAHWIAKGLPGAGNVLVFNNGNFRVDGSYSSVDEIVLPRNKDNSYERKKGQPFGPSKAEWSYVAPKKTDFYSFFVSGAHRLPNGNTLICSGYSSTIFEVTKDKEVVWKFVNPKNFESKIANEAVPMKDEENKMDEEKKELKKGFPGMINIGGLFRACRIDADHPALKGRELTLGVKLGD
jgi:hypothetical protein